MISFGILEPLRIFIISDYFWPIIFGVPAILLAVIFILEKRAKKWYAKNKILVYEKSFFMLKDRINNIYILIAINIKIMIMMNGTENIAVK